MGNILSLYDLLLIDIETVPQESDNQKLSPEVRQLFFDRFPKTMPEIIDDEQVYRQKAGIMAEFGKVICISTGFFYKDENGNTCIKIKTICDDNEPDLLRNFITHVDKFSTYKKNFQFAGHNIREFDIPFLCRRMIIHQIPLPSYLQIHGAKPWEVKMVDTMQWWRFGDYKNFTSLHLLATVLGIPTSKDDINGSMVQDVYYQENDLPRIVNYCQKDVIVVGQIIRRFFNKPLVHNENVVVVK